jgi:hypothetical protein
VAAQFCEVGAGGGDGGEGGGVFGGQGCGAGGEPAGDLAGGGGPGWCGGCGGQVAERPDETADGLVGAGVALGPDLRVRGGGVAGAGVPLPDEVGLVGVEGGVAGGGGDLAGARGFRVLADGRAGQAQGPGGGGLGVAGVQELADLGVPAAGPPGQARLVPGRARLVPGRGGGRGGRRLVFRLALAFRGGQAAAPVGGGGLAGLLAQVVPQVPAVGGLDRARGALAGAL